jgi:hypothetical protein
MMGHMRLVATVLSLAMLAAPILSDWCLLSCEASVNASSGASCHHAGDDSSTRVQAQSTPCGHDDEAGEVTVAMLDRSAQTSKLLQAIVPVPSDHGPAITWASSPLESPPDRVPAPTHSLARPLRI